MKYAPTLVVLALLANGVAAAGELADGQKALAKAFQEVASAEALLVRAKEEPHANREARIATATELLKLRREAFDALAAGPEGALMSPASAEFVSILERATKDLKIPKSGPYDRAAQTKNCQHYFRAIAGELAAAGLPSWVEQDFPDTMMAHDIAVKLASCPQGCDAHWREVTREQAQDLANRGGIVVGAKRKDASGHGHLGMVMPVSHDFDPAKHPVVARPGEDPRPMIRDGNDHGWAKQKIPTGWGAAPARIAFADPGKGAVADAGLTATKFYLWQPPAEGKE